MKVKDILSRSRGKIYIGERNWRAEDWRGGHHSGRGLCVMDTSSFECRDWSGWNADADDARFKVHRNPIFDKTVDIILPTIDGGICICYRNSPQGGTRHHGRRTQHGNNTDTER